MGYLILHALCAPWNKSTITNNGNHACKCSGWMWKSHISLKFLWFITAGFHNWIMSAVCFRCPLMSACAAIQLLLFNSSSNIFIHSKRNPDCCHSCSEDAWRGTSEETSYSSSELLWEKCVVFWGVFLLIHRRHAIGMTFEIRQVHLWKSYRGRRSVSIISMSQMEKSEWIPPGVCQCHEGCLLSLDSFHVWGIDLASRQTKIIIKKMKRNIHVSWW